MTLKSGKQLVTQLGRVSLALADDGDWQKPVAVAAKDDHIHALRADLGDTSFSGWRHAAPVQMQAEVPAKKDELTVRPTSRTRGPWRIAEDGRDAKRAGQFRSRGVRTRKKDGSTYTRLVQLSRGVGAMNGWKSWSDGQDLALKNTPDRIRKAKWASVGKAMK